MTQTFPPNSVFVRVCFRDLAHDGSHNPTKDTWFLLALREPVINRLLEAISGGQTRTLSETDPEHDYTIVRAPRQEPSMLWMIADEVEHDRGQVVVSWQGIGGEELCLRLALLLAPHQRKYPQFTFTTIYEKESEN